MSSTGDLWWHNPSIDQVFITDEEIDRLQLPNQILTRFVAAFVNNKFHTRPTKSATRKWLETVIVDGNRINLSCRLETDWITITRIRIPRGAYKDARLS